MVLTIAKRVAGQLVVYVLLAGIALYLFVPLYWALATALKPDAEAIASPATFFPRQLTLDHFRAVFRNASLMRSVLNSLVVAIGTTLLSLLIGTFAAFALSKLRFRFRTPTLYLVLAMTTFPAISLLSGLYRLYGFVLAAALPWFEFPTQLLLIALNLIFALPFAVWTLTYFFRGLPDSLLQAARIDGASALQVIGLVVLPLAAPALVSAGLIIFVTTWNEYLFALTFTAFDPGAQTVPVAMQGYYGLGVPIGNLLAAALVVTLPTLLPVLVFQRRISAGLTAGALKE